MQAAFEVCPTFKDEGLISSKVLCTVCHIRFQLQAILKRPLSYLTKYGASGSEESRARNLQGLFIERAAVLLICP